MNDPLGVLVALAVGYVWLRWSPDYQACRIRRYWRKAVPRRKRVSPWVRRYVFARSGGVCCQCHRPMNWRWNPQDMASYEVDHRVPWSFGGVHGLPNFQALCKGCNGRKGASITLR